jgi:hypothetical protein
MKKLFIKAVMTVEESDKYAGKLLKAEDCKKVFSEDVDLYDKDTKQLLAKFRTKVIPGNIQKAGYENLLEAATVTDNRRTAGAGKPVTSGVAGYFDPAGGRFPICRLKQPIQYLNLWITLMLSWYQTNIKRRKLLRIKRHRTL